MKKIGLMGAMKDEIAPLYEAMSDRREETVGGVTFYEGVLDNKDVVLCCAGMGKAQAAAATQLLCSHFCVDAVLFSGIAGNMTSKVDVGDVVIGKTLVYHDGEPRMFAETAPFLQEFTGDERLIEAAGAACASHCGQNCDGRLLCGRQCHEKQHCPKMCARLCGNGGRRRCPYRSEKRRSLCHSARDERQRRRGRL